MRALALAQPGGALALTRLPVPRPAAEQLLVRVLASSINPIDVRVATGRYPGGDYAYPLVPGFDFAGVVEGTGPEATRFRAGDEVLGYWDAPRFHRGTWAEYVTVGENRFVASKPAGMSFDEAGAVPLAGVTALLMLDACAPAAGETVLIVGAGGAIGGYAVQAAARAGATVIATAKPGHEHRLRGLGATETLDYTRQDIVDAVRDRFPAGIDALLDLPNGRREVARLSTLVRDGGRVASACFGADVAGLAERAVAATNVAASTCDPRLVARLAALVESGELSIGYDEVCGLEGAPGAVRDIAAGASRKTVIRVSR